MSKGKRQCKREGERDKTEKTDIDRLGQDYRKIARDVSRDKTEKFI